MPITKCGRRVILSGAGAVQNTDGHMVYEFDAACHLGVKLAGVHWWFKSRAHAAELTAGYYNTRERDGYADLMAVLKRNNARLSFTCVEMRDCEHPPEGRCSPQGVHPPCLAYISQHCVCLSVNTERFGVLFFSNLLRWKQRHPQ